MKYIKKFSDETKRDNYIKSNFISPHLFFETTNKTLNHFEKFKRLTHISSTQTGGQYINLNCKLFENTDDIRIDIKFNMKGGGKDWDDNRTTGVNQTKPSVLIGSISENGPYYGFVVRKADINTTNDNYVTMYTKWQISNSVEKNANGDQSGKKKWYPTYLAGNITGYEQTPTNQVYEKTLIIDNLNTISNDIFSQMSHLKTDMFAIYNDSTLGSNVWKGTMWRYCEADIYYCKIMKGNTVVRDLVPMLRVKDNAPGLYDLEHDVFYPSQGDQPFVAGSVIE